MAVAKEKERQEPGLVRFYRETRAELRKVVWPTRQETIRLTILVIVVSVLIGLLLFFGDTIFIWLYSQLVGLVE
ncbi:MAG: preprotein translocase subunit SecE [Chloroflexaceae bacterium]|nr:preprotein translocase subunit SecE [Chloroflexaceae bacterium]